MVPFPRPFGNFLPYDAFIAALHSGLSLAASDRKARAFVCTDNCVLTVTTLYRAS